MDNLDEIILEMVTQIKALGLPVFSPAEYLDPEWEELKMGEG